MFDLRAIRENPEMFDRGWARRGLEPQTPKILELDQEHRRQQTELQHLQSERNAKSREIGKIKSEGGDAQPVMDEVASIKDQMNTLEDRERETGQKLNDLLSRLPNLPDESVPAGQSDADNAKVREFGTPEKTGPDQPDHVTIGEALGLLDQETAARISGARFVVLRGDLARLERALAQFMIDLHTREHGYEEVSPPVLVRAQTLYGTGQLPKFSEDLFKTTSDHWLIPTAEVPLTNLVADQILDTGQLPLRFTAHTGCFRSEAGSAGRDTRGMLRQHQFYKVELVSITHPEQSYEELEKMTDCAETILKQLNLPFRTVALCEGDLGFAAHKTYDIEVWLPGQESYREISSCSNCGAFQARRMQARARTSPHDPSFFVHTLNGSGVAVGRALIAVIENFWDAGAQCIHVPDVLQPYMGGQKRIETGKKAAA